VIGRPTAGVRLEIERDVASNGSVIRYAGFVFLPDADLPIAITIDLPGGAVAARLEAPASVGAARAAELERAAAALVRAATKGMVAANHPLPRKIVRWRP
jgi:hypothetical protein